MALYAYDESKTPIYAGDAEERRSYRCCGCNKTVRLRKGLSRIPHFYHLKLSVSCRLYGKSQDHLLTQLALQKMLPLGESKLEKSFPEINRVGDLVWEREKIIFEIQCSNIELVETEQRVSDYLKMGYHVVWILDDRVFNRQIARPAEKSMRQRLCYFARIRGQELPIIYDQFEILLHNRRIKKGQRLEVQLDSPSRLPSIPWEGAQTPKQVIQKTLSTNLHFKGDLLHKALLSLSVPSLATTMRNMRALELFYAINNSKENQMTLLIDRCIREPLRHLLYWLQEINERLG